MLHPPKIGGRVSYEDSANPRRVGAVKATIDSPWGTEFRIVFEDGTETTSDCRQSGWRKEQP